MYVCSALTSLVVLAFFVLGVGDGSVSSFNLLLWLAILGGAAASLWVGHALYARSRFALSMAVLALTAVPGILALFFVLFLLIAQPRWN
jgi:hypothetical protein